MLNRCYSLSSPLPFLVEVKNVSKLLPGPFILPYRMVPDEGFVRALLTTFVSLEIEFVS